MRVLHIVKTSDGAFFAAWQAAELVRRGVDIHVAVPSPTGSCIPEWTAAGAKIHVAALDVPARSPWLLGEVCRRARALVREVSPDLVHSHFVGTTILLRLALGTASGLPRIFQVPGPLHTEHGLFRRMELATAGDDDYWIGSSRYTVGRYLRAGIPASRVFLSYYGWPCWKYMNPRTGILRSRLGIRDDQFVVGNMNWIYAPKFHLGQFVGLKCHEDVIDALAIVTHRRREVIGILAGGGWGRGRRYEGRLHKRAAAAAGDRIRMPGHLAPEVVCKAWADFDCAVHVPLSENCGGVLEPLLAGVPTIGGAVGGIPELVIDGLTGKLVPIRRPAELAEAILEVLDHRDRYRRIAAEGQRRTSELMDVRRTAVEVLAIYRHLLDRSCPPPPPYECAGPAITLATEPTGALRGSRIVKGES